MVTKPKKSNFPRRDALKWTERVDDIFINSLINQQMLGNRIDNIFLTAAYENMLREMREKLGMPFQKDRLKNRLKRLKNHFRECSALFKSVSGFIWSPETKMFSAKPEAWKAFVKETPEAKKWMTTQITHYDKLTLLFANDRKRLTPKPKVSAPESYHVHGALNKQNEITLNIDLEDLNEINDGLSQLATPI
ncbi:hypothetical protein M5689_025374 [Euphorbia peplus]|nr:hypothetical protein M5689_025374 [Euphorbia peplus]